MGGSTLQIITMESSMFLFLSLAVVIAIADSVDPFDDVVPESDTLLQRKQMADLSAQHSELRQRVQNLEESLTSTTSPAESLLQASKGRKAHSIDKLIESLIKKGPTKIYGVKRCSSGYTTLYVNDKKTPCIRGMKK